MTTKPEILSSIEEDNKQIQRLKLEIKHKKQMLALLERQEEEKRESAIELTPYRMVGSGFEKAVIPGQTPLETLQSINSNLK